MRKHVMKRSYMRAMSTRTVVYTALMTALVTAATLVLGFRTGDFFFNCGDAVIFITAALFGPVPAMIAGGFGAFFADLASYPATMFFTLGIKAVEGLICGLLLMPFRKSRALVRIPAGIIAMAISGALMMTGYYVCNSFFYGSPASAIVALPADAVQASVSVAVASLLLYAARLEKLKDKLMPSRADYEAKHRDTAEAYGDAARTTSEHDKNGAE